jgi:hypothetical protein
MKTGWATTAPPLSLGSARVSRAGDGVPPLRTFLFHQRASHAPKNPSSLQRDAATRSAAAPAPAHRQLGDCLPRHRALTFSMTAAQIIEEIKRLSPEEQAAAVRLVYQLDAERKLSFRP